MKHQFDRSIGQTFWSPPAEPGAYLYELSRNFGQHCGITAGLDYCPGDWVAVMDCDLQDQPEDIPRLYAKAREGYDVVTMGNPTGCTGFRVVWLTPGAAVNRLRRSWAGMHRDLQKDPPNSTPSTSWRVSAIG